MFTPDKTNKENEPQHIKENINSVVFDVNKYADENSFGALLAGNILGKHGEKLKSIDAEEFYKRNEKKLKELGLGVESSELKDFHIYTKNKEEVPTKLFFNIEDSKKLNDSLAKLQPNLIDKQTAMSIKSILDSLLSQVKNAYKLNDPEENRLLNLFSGLKDLLNNCKRLDPQKENGLFLAVESLDKLSETSKAGYMKEFILAEKNGLLEGNFGPRDWLVGSETNIVNYEKFWNDRAFSTLEILKNNNQAKGLFELVKEKLKSDLDFIGKDIDELVQRLEKQKEDKNDDERLSRIYKIQIENCLKIKSKILPEINSRLENY